MTRSISCLDLGRSFCGCFSDEAASFSAALAALLVAAACCALACATRCVCLVTSCSALVVALAAAIVPWYSRMRATIAIFSPSRSWRMVSASCLLASALSLRAFASARREALVSGLVADSAVLVNAFALSLYLFEADFMRVYFRRLSLRILVYSAGSVFVHAASGAT